MPTYPLPTLAPTITATGITAPAFEDIYNSLVASFQGIYGADTVLTPDTQDGQWIAVLATAQNDTNNAIIAVYNNFIPTYAQGAGLSAMVKINGIRRKVGSNSTALVVLVGQAGTIILSGVAEDQLGNLWDLPSSVTIPNSGTITVTATAEQSGNIAAGPNTINIVYAGAPLPAGWQSVTNPSAATLGLAVELDPALRQRQTVSTALPGQTPLQAIAAALDDLPDVGRVLVYQNDTNETDSNGIPSHSIAAVVEDGTSTEIAQAIESKKAPGTGTYGSTTVIVTDPSGVPIPIQYFALTQTQIYAAIVVQPLDNWVSSTVQAIQAAAVAFINSLAIGEDVYFAWMWGPAGLSGQALGITFRITSLTIGLSAGSLGTADIDIAFNAAPLTSTPNIVVTVL